MLVDLAPYLFRGRLAGFLTRLSATGLANVTSGGGQVPSFVVRASRDGPTPSRQEEPHRKVYFGPLTTRAAARCTQCH